MARQNVAVVSRPRPPLPRRMAARLLHVAGWLILRSVGPRRAYATAMRLIDAAYPCVAPIYRLLHPQQLPRDRRDLLLRHLLCAMTRLGGLDVPVRLEGGEDLDAAYAAARRVIAVTAHFPLTPAVHLAVRSRGYDTATVVVPNLARGISWGLCEPVKLLDEGPGALIKARRWLGDGGVVGFHADYPSDSPEESGDRTIRYVSPNAFAFARLTATPVLFFGARLDANREIVVDMHLPVHFQPRTADDVEALADEFIDFVERRSGWRCRLVRPERLAAAPAPESAPTARAAGGAVEPRSPLSKHAA